MRKFFIQLNFFGIALFLTIASIATWFALFQDSTPQGVLQVTPIDNYTDDEWKSVFIGGLVCPILSIMIYFKLWKTKFFSRNKQN